MALVTLGAGTQAEIINRIKEMLPDDEISKMEKEIISNGICYMLSMEWMLSVMREGFNARLEAFNDKAEVEHNLYYYKQIANNFQAYAQNVALKSNIKNGKKVNIAFIFEEVLQGEINTLDDIDKLFVELASNAKVRSETSPLLEKDDEIKAYIKAKQAKNFLLRIRFIPKEIQYGHMTAVTQLQDGKFIFYDPNAGVCKADSMDDILQFIRRDYTNLKYVTVTKMQNV